MVIRLRDKTLLSVVIFYTVGMSLTFSCKGIFSFASNFFNIVGKGYQFPPLTAIMVYNLFTKDKKMDTDIKGFVLMSENLTFVFLFASRRTHVGSNINS